MSFTEKEMYELLPAIYRTRDAGQGSPLKALIGIIAEQAGITGKNIDNLYDNWFIETCDDWVIPYIGDLLGVSSIFAVASSGAVSQRAYVANTLAYRRRKGTAPVLEQLAADITGWRAHVTEFFELLGATQYMNHLRPHRTLAPDLRKMNQLDLINSPFDTIAHTVDVRSIALNRGCYNIPNIGLFVWRLQSYPVGLSDAGRITGSCPSPFFTFDPLGNNCSLFNRPEAEKNITQVSAEINVPGLLRRLALNEELEARRAAIVNGEDFARMYFDESEEDGSALSTKMVFEIFPGSESVPVPPEEILICNLEECCVPPVKKTYQKREQDGTLSDHDLPVTVAVDPVNGRFIFTDNSISSARVSYAYGFSGDLGSGTYNRQDTIPDLFSQRVEDLWHVGVSKTETTIGGQIIYPTLKQALNAWNSGNKKKTGVISIMDSGSYSDDLDITMEEESNLLIVAAGWPKRGEPESLKRLPGDLSADKLRPHISGNMVINGSNADNTVPADKKGGRLWLNGLLLEGKLTIQKGNLAALHVFNSTLVPSMGGIEAGADTTEPSSNQWLSICLNRCICGPLLFHQTFADLIETVDCILDRAGSTVIEAGKMRVKLTRTTFFGQVLARSMEAENCLFDEPVTVERRQEGCMRFCFVPPEGSLTPRRFRCQPELEWTEQIADSIVTLSTAAKDKIRTAVTDWLKPAFTSRLFGHHAYAQLSSNCPVQISAGADDASEMGAFNFLRQPQRKTNLDIALSEYMPVGLKAGIIYVT